MPHDDFGRIIDFDRLMEGEDRRSTDPADAEHWAAVYSELLSFKERLLAETAEKIQDVPETEPELGQNDVPFLAAEMRRLREGLAFWEARRPKNNNSS
jgi:hypothetical protein